MVLALAAGLAWWLRGAPDPDRPRLALLTSLPLYWPETGAMGDMLAQDTPQPWAKQALVRDYRVEPLDTLAPVEEGGAAPLAPYRLLLLAQPRVLSPQENVALDSWVRGGGHVLVYADPLLVAESRYPMGDPRRPVGAALLSPILAHWGLELQFDADQPQGEHIATLVLDRPAGRRVQMPVEMAGRFRIVPGGDGADCTLSGNGLLAQCRIGKGVAVLVADAQALLPPHGDLPMRADALRRFLAATAR